MAFRVRSSKFRHVFGNGAKKEQCYDCIKITKNAHDSNYCAVNPKFVAVVTESAGGGAFLLLPLEKTGRVDINAARVCGHAGPVLDVKWNPFNDYVIASCSDDATVKVWQVPDTGLKSNLTEWLVDLHGHTRRVGHLEWHPTAENILLSAGYDFKCILWNTETAEPINIIEVHSDTIFSISWNLDGSLFATTSKDKKIRVIDPREGTVISEGNSHAGSKAAKVVFTGKSRLFTTGFSRMSERQYGVWDCKNLSKALRIDTIDCSSGVLFPYYDHDTRVVFVAGKGDGNIRYYELVDDPPYIHYLSQYQSGTPQRGLGIMPKRGVDPYKCEIVRFYKLHAVKGMCEPISMIVPRKSEMFQDDIFPPTASACPSLSADEWISGQNREPILVSLKDGAVSSSPTITTYKAVKRAVSSSSATVTSSGSSLYDSRLKRQGAPPPVATVQPSSPSRLPSSIKNIKKLSVDNAYVSIQNNNNVSDDKLKSEESVSEKIEDLEKKAHISLTKGTTKMTNSNEPLRVDKKVWSSTYTDPRNGTPTSNGTGKDSTEADMSPQASPPRKRVLGQRGSVSQQEQPKGTDQKAMLEEKNPEALESPLRKRLSRQNTDVSDTSECFATPPTSPLNQSALSPAQKSPVTWNKNPLFGANTHSSPTHSPTRSQSFRTSVGKSNSSPTRSTTRSHSFRSARSSFGPDSPSSPPSRISVRSVSRSSSVGSPTGSGNYFTFSTSEMSSTPGAELSSSPPTKRAITVNNESSVISQQKVTTSADPPPPPTRTDSITKARKKSRKLDTENMLFGGQDTIQENKEKKKSLDTDTKANKVRGSESVEIVNIVSSAPNRRVSFDGLFAPNRRVSFDANLDIVTPRNEKVDSVDVADQAKVEVVNLTTNTANSADTKNYLDGFLIGDAPDNTLIKPSKLRESMRRKNRSSRAQTAPVERAAVDKALNEIDRKWGKPERTSGLSHLPLADRLALKKRRSDREQNNNEINKLLVSDTTTSSVAVTKVLTADDGRGMNTPVSNSGDAPPETPSITPVLHLSHTEPLGPNRNRSPPPSRTPTSPIIQTSRSENVSTRYPTSQNVPTPSVDPEIENSGVREPVRTNRDRVVGRSSNVDNHRVHIKKVWSPPISAPDEASAPKENGMPHTDPELRKAYFRQVEEIRSLKEQISLKDHRIRQLEEEVRILREDKDLAGESHC